MASVERTGTELRRIEWAVEVEPKAVEVVETTRLGESRKNMIYPCSLEATDTTSEQNMISMIYPSAAK